MKKSSLFQVLTIILCLVLTIGMCAVVVTASGETTNADSDDYTTTTTVVPDYATRLDYDDSPMAVGETRAIRFYHPVTNTAAGGSIYEVSDNLSVSYEEGSDTVYVTALSEGSAKLYIRESDCAFGAYAYLTVEEETTTTTIVPDYTTRLDYDDSPMAVGETRAIRFYHPVTNTAAGGSIYEVSDNLSVSYEEGSDTVYVTALSEGSAKLYIRESDCAFGAYVYLTVEEEEPVLCFPQGDVNQDGKLTTGDARMVLQYCLADVAFLQNDVNALADYDGNGKIETSDARNILIATLAA